MAQAYWNGVRYWNQSIYADQYRESEVSQQAHESSSKELAGTPRRATGGMMEVEIAHDRMDTQTKRNNEEPGAAKSPGSQNANQAERASVC